MAHLILFKINYMEQDYIADFENKYYSILLRINNIKM